MDHQFYKELLDALTDGVYFVDLERTVTYWNKAAERLSGYPAQEVVGRKCSDNVLRHVDEMGNSLCLDGCPLAMTMDDGLVREANVYMHHKYGYRVPVFVRASPMRDETGAIIGAVEVFADNSRNLVVLDEIEALRKEILTDPLTEVGNRRYADICLEGLDHSMQESGVPFGIFFVDIDNFKRINDTFGHHIGDKIIGMVAKTLSSALRTLDVACRWGGEEFILLIPNITLTSMDTMGERLRMLVEQSWIDHKNTQVRVTASFGGAVSLPGETVASVVKRADRQLYRSKDAGRNCVHIDQSQMATPCRE